MKWVVDDWWLASSFKDFMRSIIDTRKNLFHVWCQSEKFENTNCFFFRFYVRVRVHAHRMYHHNDIYLFVSAFLTLASCLLGQVSRQLALFVFCFMISCAGREFHLVSSLSASFKTQFVSPARFKDTRKSVRQLSNMRGRVDDECSVVRASLSTWREEYSLHADSPYVVLRERIKIVKHVTVPAVAL